MISLTHPGMVALSEVGVKIGFYHVGADGYHGHFVCSDEELNKIWYASAYTLQTNMLPPAQSPRRKSRGTTMQGRLEVMP